MFSLPAALAQLVDRKEKGFSIEKCWESIDRSILHKARHSLLRTSACFDDGHLQPWYLRDGCMCSAAHGKIVSSWLQHRPQLSKQTGLAWRGRPRREGFKLYWQGEEAWLALGCLWCNVPDRSKTCLLGNIWPPALPTAETEINCGFIMIKLNFNKRYNIYFPYNYIAICKQVTQKLPTISRSFLFKYIVLHHSNLCIFWCCSLMVSPDTIMCLGSRRPFVLLVDTKVIKGLFGYILVTWLKFSHLVTLFWTEGLKGDRRWLSTTSRYFWDPRLEIRPEV